MKLIKTLIELNFQIQTMPGLPTRPAFYDIDIDPETQVIEGLFWSGDAVFWMRNEISRQTYLAQFYIQFYAQTCYEKENLLYFGNFLFIYFLVKFISLIMSWISNTFEYISSKNDKIYWFD